MPIIRPKIRYGAQEWNTYCEVEGYEQDVCVHYDTSPAEPDVGSAGGLDITAVVFEAEGCVMSRLSDDELEQLELRVNEHENDRTDPYNDPRY